MSELLSWIDASDEASEAREWDAKYFGTYRRDTPDYIYEGLTSEDEYEERTVQLVEDLLMESKNKWKDIKTRWAKAAYRLQMFERLATKAGVDKTDMPMTPQAIEESIALMCEGLSQPQPHSRDAEQDAFVDALAHFFERELAANNYDMLLAQVIYQQKTQFMGILKMIFEEGHPGPYTKDGRITMRSINPQYFHPDPLAKGTRFEDSRYWIFAEPEDTADVRARFPGRGHLVQPENDYTLMRCAKENDVVPIGNFHIGQRQRVLVKECWLRDERKVFVPELDGNGDEIPIDAKRVRGLSGERGKQAVEGHWEKRYPHGRLIVCAGQILLYDGDNPFPHGEPPYTLFPVRISDEIFAWSDVELLGVIEDKINRLHKDMIRNARVNMNAPWIADRNCFDSPRKFNLLVNDPGLVLPITPGSHIERLPPAELPQFIWPLLNWLKGIFDDVLGVQAVMRGQLEKGSQLSAGAIEGLQVSSSSRLRFRARLLENSLKCLGYQLEWMIRTFYPEDLTVQIMDPATQKPIPLKWTSPPAEMGNFEIGIEVGSGLPGSKEQGGPLYIKLWQLDLIPRITALKALKVPNAEQVAAQMDKDDVRQAQLGIVRRKNKDGAAGRKQLDSRAI